MNNFEARQAIETVLRIEDLHLGSIRGLRRVQDYLREVEREGKEQGQGSAPTGSGVPEEATEEMLEACMSERDKQYPANAKRYLQYIWQTMIKHLPNPHTNQPDPIADDYARCLHLLGVPLDVDDDLPICLGDMVDEMITNQPDSEQGGEWVSVDERLPEDCKGVIGFSREYGSNHMFYCYKDKRWEEDGYACAEDFIFHDVTHWMPMPQPPKSKEGE